MLIRTPLILSCTSYTATRTSLRTTFIQIAAPTQPNLPSKPPFTFRTMASATSFYDFKPKDSMFCLTSLTSTLLPHSSLSSKILKTILPPQQKRANPTTSPPSRTKSSSSSTPPPNAASRPNTPPSKHSTRKSRPRTKTLSSSAFPATNSWGKTPAPTTKSKTSAL